MPGGPKEGFLDLSQVLNTEANVHAFFQGRDPIEQQYLLSGNVLLQHLANIMQTNGLLLQNDFQGKYHIDFMTGSLLVNKQTGVVEVFGVH